MSHEILLRDDCHSTTKVSYINFYFKKNMLKIIKI
jgi:hypothetical protein